MRSVFSVLQTTSEIPSHVDRLLMDQNTEVVAQHAASVGNSAFNTFPAEPGLHASLVQRDCELSHCRCRKGGRLCVTSKRNCATLSWDYDIEPRSTAETDKEKTYELSDRTLTF